MTPGSLAIISASLREEDRGAAIGLWSGLGGVAGAIGPLFGGWLVEVAGWRSVFLLNIPLAIVVVWAAVRHVPESRDPHPPEHLDVVGSACAVVGLGALTYGLIEVNPIVGLIGVIALCLFVVVERRSPSALVPPSLFRSRMFVAANLVTLAVYAALGGVFFLLVLGGRVFGAGFGLNDPVMATAAKRTVATVHEVLELGQLDPEAIVTPGIFVTHIVPIARVATQAGGFKVAA